MVGGLFADAVKLLSQKPGTLFTTGIKRGFMPPHISRQGERRARGYSEFGTLYPFFRDHREMCDLHLNFIFDLLDL